MTAAGMVTLTAVEPAGASLRLHLVGDAALSGGGAQWEIVPRPRRTSATEWVGTDPHQMAMPLLLDGMDVVAGGGDRPVEADCDLLAAWQRPIQSTPPPIVVAAGPLPIPAYGLRWVITSVEWGTAVRGADGRRIQQEVTVTLLEHTVANILFGPAAAARARAGL